MKTSNVIIKFFFAGLIFILVTACTSKKSQSSPDGDIENEADLSESTEQEEEIDAVEADGDTDGMEIVEEETDGENAETAESESESEEDQRTVAELLPIEATVSCTPAADACATAETVDATYAYYRKDYFFPTEVYPEPTEEPLDGGRFQIVTIAKAAGTVTEIVINGISAEDLLTQQKIEWYHYWPQTLIVGEPVWVAFHSRKAEWDSAENGELLIRTETEEAVNTEFTVAGNSVPITYVTVNEARNSLLIHLKNNDSMAHDITRLIVNGRDVLAAGIACLPSATIEAGEAVMLTVPLCLQIDLGAPWNVVVEFDDITPSVGAGRVIRPFFPIEVWPSSSECPLPGVNDAVHQMALNGGIDTFYIYWNGYQGCGYDRDEMFNVTLPERGDTYLLLGDDFPFTSPPENALPNKDAILGFLTGDESDWNIYDEDGYPNAAKKAAKTRDVWTHFPDLFTYNGAMTNKRIGTFAGMADVQGIDLYAAACAPHVLDYGNHPPLRAPYDYLKNARNNHMPLPTWLYSQGLGGWYTLPAPQEILTQAISVAAAGGKGLMWFQFLAEMANENPDVWAAMSDANWIFRGIRKYLREGDITGMASSDENTIVELIRAGDAIVVPIITLAADVAPTDAECTEFGLGMEPEAPHWILTERDISVNLTLPEDFPVVDAFEISSGQPVDMQYPASLNGREISISSIPVSNDLPIHVFIFAAKSQVREEVATAMTRPNTKKQQISEAL